MALEPIETTLEKVFILTPTVRTFRFRFPEGQWVPFQAGQFCMVQVPSEPKPVKKAYSISSAPFEEGYLDLCIKKVEGGFATTWFWTLNGGEKITLALPYGGFVLKNLQPEIIFIGTGTGLAPLRSMIKTLFHQGCTQKVSLIFGVRHEEEMLYTEEWQELEKKHTNFRFIPTVSRPQNIPAPWTGEVGYVQDKLKKFFPDPKGKQIYICGLIPMIDGVQKVAAELGYDKKQIHFEKYV